jgi:hypothetical protein
MNRATKFFTSLNQLPLAVAQDVRQHLGVNWRDTGSDGAYGSNIASKLEARGLHELAEAVLDGDSANWYMSEEDQT